MVRWKQIKVKVPLGSAVFANALGEELESIMKEPQKDLERYVQPFRSKNRPKILLEKKTKPTEVSVFTGVKSNWSKGKKATKEDKLMFIFRGTKKRYATMPPNYKSKTSPNTLMTRNVRGNRDPLYVDTRVPREGIDARNVEDKLHKKYNKKIQLKLLVAMPKIALKAGFGLM